MRRWLRVASLGAVLAAVGASWYFFAPDRQLGGSSRAVVYGSSMQPISIAATS